MYTLRPYFHTHTQPWTNGSLWSCFYRCKGLILLETYTSLTGDKLKAILPKFLNIVKEVTGQPDYSMFNLSLREDWNNTKKFCYSLHGKNTCCHRTAASTTTNTNTTSTTTPTIATATATTDTGVDKAGEDIDAAE